MSAAYTPGPWQVSPFRAQVICNKFGRDGDFLPVAQMLWPTDERTEAETYANGYVIAAAPDMLAMLFQYADDLRYPPEGDSRERRLAAVQALIVKAQGAA